jgi:sporulation protein YlmC with PRC-barrel domain
MADRGSKKSRRGMRDEAGVGPNPNDARRLVPMKDLHNYKVVDGEPDIRGWNVFTATGRELGEIEDLLVDTDIGEVVMIDIDLKRDDRHTMFDVDGETRSGVVADRSVRYGPSHEKMVVEEVVRRRVVDPADLSPAETERLRQQSGDITTDARDTLVNPPPTEERR